jgi:hypothetical protein
MTVQSAAGASLGISSVAPGTYNEAGFAALTFTNCGEITNLGDFGRIYELIKHNALDTRATTKLKGSYDEGQLPLELGFDAIDAGQTALRAASVSDADFYFQVQLQSGKKFWFAAKVMGFRIKVGSVNDIVGAMVPLELTSVGGQGIVESA